MSCDQTTICKAIGSAIIGISNKVGCVICPKFPEDARCVRNGKVTLLKYKFRKLGIRT